LLVIATFLHGCAAFEGQVDCPSLDLKATKLAAEKDLDEAAKAFDQAIASCPRDASRLTSRGVLYAAMGHREKAAETLNEAVSVAQERGDACRADLAKAELAVINGSPPLSSLPSSCKSSR
jgi:regulator of sirC expression with transglutaminase-like and TPR domain